MGGRPRSGRFYLIVAGVVGVLAFVIGILIGRFAACDESGGGSQEGAFDRIIQDADPEISDILIERINNNNIRDNLRDLTKKPHIAGEQADFDLVTYLKDKLTGYGLDSVRVAPYQVLLSYPNGSDPNRAQLLNVTSGDVIFDSTTAESNISHLPGGELVYVNYGRVEDYDYLEHNYNVNVTEKIVIARYGRIFRGSKVDIAARHGAIGIIIYSDPADYTDPDDDRVFPDTVWLPGTAYRWPENETENPLPAIPAHCMGYDGAKPFLEALGGQVAPQDWTGRIKGLSYRIGPSVAKIRLSTHTYNSVRKAETVIAIVRGAVEPDRYVLMGNHRDAWVYGSIDPSSGTAVMMEVARVMAQLAKEGGVLVAPSCSAPGARRNTQYVKSLGARAVAYANIDIAVQGNYSLRALGTPLLYRSIFEAAKKVPNPNPDEVAANRRTVYDTWRASFPWEGQDLPRVGALGSGSDYAPMLQIVGITSVDFRYTYDSNKYKLGSYPLYHTEYETFKTMQGYLDRDFEYHRAVARVGAELVRSLADSLIIPFNVSDYAWGLELMEEQLDKEFGDMLRGNLSDYSNLAVAIKSFADDVKNFEMSAANINKKDPMAIRMVNDQLLLLEKAFLDPSGLPSRPLKKHLLFAENSNDIYAGSSFPGLVDLLFEIDLLEEPERSERWRKVEHHFSVLLNAIQSAGYTLRDVVNFVEETY
ncbi:hypothetical protein BaRGS_00005917 [Batillaria attramentaria]|uniref:Aminopeptidase NAALADL1 n=1 Tax=Batillaria attramentaria TaxID=370345 RepID=A0ABD0LT65_9CAEN